MFFSEELSSECPFWKEWIKSRLAPRHSNLFFYFHLWNLTKFHLCFCRVFTLEQPATHLSQRLWGRVVRKKRHVHLASRNHTAAGTRTSGENQFLGDWCFALFADHCLFYYTWGPRPSKNQEFVADPSVLLFWTLIQRCFGLSKNWSWTWLALHWAGSRKKPLQMATKQVVQPHRHGDAHTVFKLAIMAMRTMPPPKKKKTERSTFPILGHN